MQLRATSANFSQTPFFIEKNPFGGKINDFPRNQWKSMNLT